MSDKKEPTDQQNSNGNNGEKLITLEGMYENYFLDYASYVILERAVPKVIDGLKPVQRRILHAMKEMDDGRYHKVANIIGQTMQYHPHGDMAIGDALVKMGQKDLLIDCQGNWGDFRTGDRAAASRYIEARLSKLALHIMFNKQTTDWQLTYDGRKKEPLQIPVKFPLLLAMGVEGIAVGLSTKILPHNFIELCKNSIAVLKGNSPKLYPDFLTGGLIDVSDYQRGKRGGKIRNRARIEQVNKNTIKITELPYNTTTTNLIDSVIKANDKGKIKIKKITDNTAKEVEILINLPSGVSPDITVDALYAFTNCEISISPNCCIIQDDKPRFIDVNEALRISTDNTVALLKKELEIKLAELKEKWHFSSLEKIFIEKRVYREIEECETWEAVIETIDRELKKYILQEGEKPNKNKVKLARKVTEEDIIRLTEIKIKRISKFNAFKADELILKLEEEMALVSKNLKNLTEFAINYFQDLLQKFGKGRERKTEIATFDTINRTQVVMNNCKLYMDRKEGFVGHSLKKLEFVCECSDIDDILVIRRDGKAIVTRIADKTFVGKDILYAGVWSKGNDRTIFNMLYVDKKSGKSYAKRFNISSVIRDKEYLLAKSEGSKVHYLTYNPNGESETVQVQLSQGCKARKKLFEFDFSTIEIKGKSAGGNTVTKWPVRKVSLKELGKSTLGKQKVWIDEVSGRLNKDDRGKFLGEFDTGDQILVLHNNGSYSLNSYEFTNRFDMPNIIDVVKWESEMVVAAVYYEGSKKSTYVKRFQIETSTQGQEFKYIGDHKDSKLYYSTIQVGEVVEFKYKSNKKIKSAKLNFDEFLDIKGWRSIGNKLLGQKLSKVGPIEESSKETKQPKPTSQTSLFKEEIVADVKTLEHEPEDLEIETPEEKAKPNVLPIGTEIEFEIEFPKDPEEDEDDSNK